MPIIEKKKTTKESRMASRIYLPGWNENDTNKMEQLILLKALESTGLFEADHCFSHSNSILVWYKLLFGTSRSKSTILKSTHKKTQEDKLSWHYSIACMIISAVATISVPTKWQFSSTFIDTINAVGTSPYYRLPKFYKQLLYIIFWDSQEQK